jgi:hypothetical protein
MNKLPAFVIAIGFLACGKDEAKPRGDTYSKNCTGAALVEPWTHFALPLADGKVCSSTVEKTDLEYLTKSRSELEAAYEQSLTALGYTKLKCHDTKGMVPQCKYEKTANGRTHEIVVNIGPQPASTRTIAIIRTSSGQYAP